MLQCHFSKVPHTLTLRGGKVHNYMHFINYLSMLTTQRYIFCSETYSFRAERTFLSSQLFQLYVNLSQMFFLNISHDIYVDMSLDPLLLDELIEKYLSLNRNLLFMIADFEIQAQFETSSRSLLNLEETRLFFLRKEKQKSPLRCPILFGFFLSPGQCQDKGCILL